MNTSTKWRDARWLAIVIALGGLAAGLAAETEPKPQPATPPAAVDFPGAGLLNSQPPFLANVKVNQEKLQYREGDKLAIEFTAERDAHLYLLYHQCDGSTAMLYPHEASGTNLAPAKQSQRIPPSDEAYRFRIRPPFGTEVIQVLASVKPIAELDQLVQKTGRAAVVPKETIAAVQQRLTQDLTSWTEHRVPIRTFAQDALPAAKPAKRVGLFVGCNKYQDEKMCSPGERFSRGALLMAQTMTERGGIDKANVKTLVAEQATKANIQEAICKWLPSVSQPGDTVFIMYTGHGGTIKSLDPSRPNEREGVLTVYDNDLGEGIKSPEEYDARSRKKLIADEALARWLQELPGRQIVLLLETCHAGAQVDAQTLGRFFARQAARVKGISQLNIAVVCACAPDESGYSDPDKPVLLAVFLSEAMQQKPRPVTLQQAFDHFCEGKKKFLEAMSKKYNVTMTGIQQPMLIDNMLLPAVLAP